MLLLHPILSHWDSGLIFSQCNYCTQPGLQVYCKQPGLILPPSVRRAVSRRRVEYVAGRICARSAIEALQHTPLFPAMGPNRAPQWPPGLTGSITHAHGRAAALVGLDHDWQGIGLDLETLLSDGQAQELAGDILTPDEQSRLARLPESQQAQQVTLSFSVKESLFKALFPLTSRPFYFQDAELMNEHHIRLLTTLSGRWQEGDILPFDWRRIDDRLLSWILIQAEDPDRDCRPHRRGHSGQMDMSGNR